MEPTEQWSGALTEFIAATRPRFPATEMDDESRIGLVALLLSASPSGRTRPASLNRDYREGGVLRKVTMTEARTQFGAVLDGVGQGAVLLTRRWKPMAVLIAPDRYRDILEELGRLRGELADLNRTAANRMVR